MTTTFSPPAWGWSAAMALAAHGQDVLPTRVGMVRRLCADRNEQSSSPHPRGDGPGGGEALAVGLSFSPPAWGWSVRWAIERVSDGVLPTRVGMVRPGMLSDQDGLGSPHPRGDGPHAVQDDPVLRVFSPPAWGWSGTRRRGIHAQVVLPTRVGMVRYYSFLTTRRPSSPHPRGDGPVPWVKGQRVALFSPPAWGWSAGCVSSTYSDAVLPTRVGMVRCSAYGPARGRRSPHPRGDGPLWPSSSTTPAAFSPPAWGWSEPVECVRRAGVVLPTRVGMVQRPGDEPSAGASSPHPRGDGPLSTLVYNISLKFSPPAWGWSDTDRILSVTINVLPTRVGMVRLSALSVPSAPRSPHPRGDGPALPN